MAVMRWDPFAGFDRMLDLMYGGAGDRSHTMPVDIYRKGDDYVVEMDLPGVDPSSIDVNVERNMLTVNAEARSTHENADEQVVCERRHARFTRQLYLGDNVDLDNVQANFDNGVLTLTAPISQQASARRIEVNRGGSESRPIEAKAS